MATLDRAEQQLNEALMKSWFNARNNPEGARARRLGIQDMKLRVIALLTGGE